VDVSLDSPGDSSNGGGASNGSTAQVTAQVVVSSETAAVNAGSSEPNGSTGTNQTAGTTTIVGSPHYITVTGNSLLSYYNVGRNIFNEIVSECMCMILCIYAKRFVLFVLLVLV
jgi:hypothetical protein